MVAVTTKGVTPGEKPPRCLDCHSGEGDGVPGAKGEAPIRGVKIPQEKKEPRLSELPPSVRRVLSLSFCKVPLSLQPMNPWPQSLDDEGRSGSVEGQKSAGEAMQAARRKQFPKNPCMRQAIVVVRAGENLPLFIRVGEIKPIRGRVRAGCLSDDVILMMSSNPVRKYGPPRINSRVRIRQN